MSAATHTRQSYEQQPRESLPKKAFRFDLSPKGDRMKRVARPDERLAALPKPALISSPQLSLNSADCLVVCAGFEDRAPRALKNAAMTSPGFTVLVIDYLPFIAENRLEEIQSTCRNARLKMLTATYDRQNPAGFGSVLI